MGPFTGHDRLSTVLEAAGLRMDKMGHVALQQDVESRALQAQSQHLVFVERRLRRIGSVLRVELASRVIRRHMYAIVDTNQVGRRGGSRLDLHAIMTALRIQPI